MGFSASDVVPFTQARANLSELADQAKAGAEKIITKNGESYVALIDADRLDYYHRLERERIRPRIAGEFEDSALLSTFAATGMGVMPAPVSLGEHLAQTHGLVQVGSTPEVQEQFHLIYSARKVMHPLLTRLLEAGKIGTLLN